MKLITIYLKLEDSMKDIDKIKYLLYKTQWKEVLITDVIFFSLCVVFFSNELKLYVFVFLCVGFIILFMIHFIFTFFREKLYKILSKDLVIIDGYIFKKHYSRSNRVGNDPNMYNWYIAKACSNDKKYVTDWKGISRKIYKKNETVNVKIVIDKKTNCAFDFYIL